MSSNMNTSKSLAIGDFSWIGPLCANSETNTLLVDPLSLSP